ncbi:zinc metalloprotease HtpX [Candidatus Roizmanbacteria bacterium]|nr:zinc metalloprotease HtpX [Candidatus Roizmanbacteria bacterium]
MTVYSQISQNKGKTFFIFFLFIILFSGFFYLIGQYFHSGNSYIILGLFLSIISSVGSYFYSDKIVLFTSGARPASKKEFFDFYTTTENLALAAGLPMPKLYVIDDVSPNAFATGRDPKHAVVCATTGLLQKLDRSDIEGVISHELSHVKNHDILISSVVAVLVGTLAIASDWIMRSLWWGRSDDNDNRNRSPIFAIFFIVALIITPIVATLIQLAISRRREFLADASGVLITRNPDGLVSALEKISSYPPLRRASPSTAHLFIANPLGKKSRSSWFVNLFSTHPPIEERIKILRSM